VSRIRGALPLIALACGFVAIAAIDQAMAAPCSFQQQGEGRVAAVVDARSFRLSDGREIRLAGIEPVASEAANRTAALSAIVAGHDVTLHGEDDTPDRYGRQPAFVFLDGSGNSVQAMLLEQGEALASAGVTDKDCAAALLAAETAAREAKQGTWAGPAVIKNAESPGDILAGNGRFMLVEGRVLSVDRHGPLLY
jgi:endonuclease YncB( thermonuclease family)